MQSNSGGASGRGEVSERSWKHRPAILSAALPGFADRYGWGSLCEADAKWAYSALMQFKDMLAWDAEPNVRDPGQV